MGCWEDAEWKSVQSELQGVKLVAAARVDVMPKRPGMGHVWDAQVDPAGLQDALGFLELPGHLAEVGNERGKISVECPGSLSYSTG